jgi:hypothetical protein
VLARLDRLFGVGLGIDPRHTLNLAHRKDAGGTHLVFVPRVDIEGKHHPPGISNGFAGSEVCGRINVESREQWLRAAASEPRDIGAMLEAVAPAPQAIERLEAGEIR